MSVTCKFKDTNNNDPPFTEILTKQLHRIRADTEPNRIPEEQINRNIFTFWK